MNSQLKLVMNDPLLKPFENKINLRRENALKKEKELIGTSNSIKDFAAGHLFFGLHRKKNGWVFREWAPNATTIYLTGTFNNWNASSEKYMLKKMDHGVWEIDLDEHTLSHGDLYKMIVHWEGGQGERIPAWARRVIQDEKTKIFTAQVWDPENSYKWKSRDFKRKHVAPLVYEAHIGMASEDYKVCGYEEFRLKVLPRIIKSGYNTIQLMAIQEHPY
jgi:1,4-alpha-glucan branching enzyme